MYFEEVKLLFHIQSLSDEEKGNNRNYDYIHFDRFLNYSKYVMLVKSKK